MTDAEGPQQNDVPLIFVQKNRRGKPTSDFKWNSFSCGPSASLSEFSAAIKGRMNVSRGKDGSRQKCPKSFAFDVERCSGCVSSAPITINVLFIMDGGKTSFLGYYL